MLKVLRHKGVAKKVLWVISGIIIISFGFGFGMSSYSEKVSFTDAAGKAFGKKVSFKEFRKKALDTRDQAMLMYGENFRKVSAMMDMDNETWTRLLLVKEADRRKIQASDPEVIAFIETVPVFQRNDEFDQKTYENIVKISLQREPRDFEEGIRDQIKIMKMFRSETNGLNVSDEEVRKEYEHRNQKVQASYSFIDPKTFISQATPSDKELQDYFDAHRADFLEPESVNIQYAVFPLAATASADEKKAIREKAKTFYTKTSQSADFNAAAKAAGAEVKETGFFNMEQPETGIGWPLDILRKIFTVATSTMIGPVEMADSVQVLKIAEKKPALVPAFDKAKKQVAEKLIAEKTLNLAKEKAAEVRKSMDVKMAAGVSFDTAVRDLGLEKKITPFFGLGDYVPEIGISNDFAAAAFSLTKEKNLSDVVITSRGPVILHQEALQPVDEKKFDEVKKDFSATLYEEKKVAAMNRVIKDIKEKAGLESYLEKVKR